MISFHIIGDGSFSKAILYMIEKAGGNISALDTADWIIPCVPSYAIPQVINNFEKKFIFVSKGMIEVNLVPEWAAQQGIGSVCLAGPHLAGEITKGLPTMSTIATKNPSYFTELAHYFPNAKLCKAVELVGLAGVIKNIVAYACGMYYAAAWGENARACIAMAGFNEIKHVADAMNLQYSEMELLNTWGVMADFILTCNSVNSRNFKAGCNQIKNIPNLELTESYHSAPLLIARVGLSEKWPVISMVAEVIQTGKIEAMDRAWNILADNPSSL